MVMRCLLDTLVDMRTAEGKGNMRSGQARTNCGQGKQKTETRVADIQSYQFNKKNYIKFMTV